MGKLSSHQPRGRCPLPTRQPSPYPAPPQPSRLLRLSKNSAPLPFPRLDRVPLTQLSLRETAGGSATAFPLLPRWQQSLLSPYTRPSMDGWRQDPGTFSWRGRQVMSSGSPHSLSPPPTAALERGHATERTKALQSETLRLKWQHSHPPGLWPRTSCLALRCR